MKLLTLQDLNVEDSLSLSFKGAFEHQSALERALEPFLQALEESAGEWMPNLVVGKRRRKYSRAAVWKALEERRTEYGSSGSGLYRTTWPAVSLALDLNIRHDPPKLRVNLDVQPLSFFAGAE